MSDIPEDDLWLGQCVFCHTQFQLLHAELQQRHPAEIAELEDEVEFFTDCTACGVAAGLPMTRQSVKVIPFSAWNVLPPSSGCAQCARDHEPDLPHDQHSLFYQMWFRNNEGRQGREERWPTWTDAMAHCEPEVRELWRQALREHGETIEGKRA